jgi:hypothetical protein
MVLEGAMLTLLCPSCQSTDVKAVRRKTAVKQVLRCDQCGQWGALTHFLPVQRDEASVPPAQPEEAEPGHLVQ